MPIRETANVTTAPAPMRATAHNFLVLNARVWTGDPALPHTEAFLIRDGRFVAVGPRKEIEARRDPETTVLDAGGRRIVPGFIDAHVHLVSGGLSLSRLALRDCRSRDEFVRAVGQRVATLRPGQWLLGRGWSTESWADKAQPTAAWIDPATAGRPALLRRMDGHCALANTAAIAAAGIDLRGPPDPTGGVIERDPATHAPTGILKDAAIDLVERVIPPPNEDEQVAATRAAMREANRFGVTTVNTMSEWKDLSSLRRVHQEQADTVRVGVFVMEKNWPEFVQRARDFPERDDRLWIAGFKDYMDGSLGARTAYMHAPYDDRPGERGLLSDSMNPLQHMAANLDAADKASFQCAIHAIGDEANHLLLDLYEDLARRNGPRDRRSRVEHAQHLLPSDIPRFARLGVIASMQPFHKADDGRYAEAAIGATRSLTSYAFRDLLDSRTALAFGSDWPVVTLDPLAGINTAVTGEILGGRRWMLRQNIQVESAVSAYTRDAAYACFKENCLGRIAPGYWADFVILEADPWIIPIQALREVRVHATYLEGSRVWPAD